MICDPSSCVSSSFAALLCFGLRITSIVNTAVVFVKILALLVFIIAGATYFQASNIYPFVPPNTDTVGQFGWTGVFRGAGKIFFAFLGCVGHVASRFTLSFYSTILVCRVNVLDIHQF